MTVRTFLSALSGVILISMSIFTDQNFAWAAAPKAINAAVICTKDVIDPAKLANWYWTINNGYDGAFESPSDLLGALKNPAAQTAGRRQIAEAIAIDLQVLVNAPGSGYRSPNLDAENYLSGQAPGSISCPTKAPPPSTAKLTPLDVPALSAAQAPTAPSKNPPPSSDVFAWMGNFRIRGISDDLIISRDSPSYSGASSATVGYTDTGTTHTTNTALKAAVGYDFQLHPADTGQLFDFIPFAAVNRSLTNVSGKQSSSSIENVTTGLNIGYSQPFKVGEFPAANVLSTSFQHTWNDIDNSQINYLHVYDIPVINGLINTYRDFTPTGYVADRWFSFKPIATILADIGYYSDLGLPSSHNHDFTQAGGQIGFDLDVEPLSSDLSVTQICMHEFEHLRNDINYFQAQWTYNIIGKDVGLKASYTNGVQEVTAQRNQVLMISLAVKY